MTIAGLGLIVVAAGNSQRMQGIEKVWADLGGHPVLWHSLNTLTSEAEETVLVVRRQDMERAECMVAGGFPSVRLVEGAQDRQGSVRNGLEALRHHISTVAVHDAARPFPAPEMLRRGAELLVSHDGAVPALPLTDTIKVVDVHGKIVMTPDRASLRLVQTPQVFKAERLRLAHQGTPAAEGPATDDAALLEAAGMSVATFQGSAENLKITTPVDLQLARLLIKG